LTTGLVYVVLGRGSGVAAAEEAGAMIERAVARVVRAARSENRDG